jgi:hypothetical protein
MPRPRKPTKSDKSSLEINVFDGTRQPFSANCSILYRVIDGNQKAIPPVERRAASVLFKGLTFFDNFGDNYTAIVSADKFHQAGFTPLKLSPEATTTLDIMLIPKNPSFNFRDAQWDAIKVSLPFLANGTSNSAGEARYEQLMEDSPAKLAGLLNITTAMGQIHLSLGTPLTYLKQVEWDSTLAQDRFFAFCDEELLNQVKTAAQQGFFAPEVGSGFFHPGATASWKQIQFGEANVQLTFHEETKKTIDGVSCILVEPDIDYYKDLAAHTLLEVIPNSLSHSLTKPEMVYVLRWIAGRHAGIPEFNPPYTIVS